MEFNNSGGGGAVENYELCEEFQTKYYLSISHHALELNYLKYFDK